MIIVIIRYIHSSMKMTGHVDGSISLETLPSLDTLFELDEMSDGEFSQVLTAGELSDLVVIRPDVDLNSS